MEEKKPGFDIAPVAWIAAGAVLGVAAWAMFSRRKAGEPLWDAESVLQACESAAAKLDEILMSEPAAQAS